LALTQKSLSEAYSSSVGIVVLARANQTGSDGIGDTPYLIDGNNRDNYPLMNPWTPPAIVTGGCGGGRMPYIN
jgi:hypothetical protein